MKKIIYSFMTVLLVSCGVPSSSSIEVTSDLSNTSDLTSITTSTSDNSSALNSSFISSSSTPESSSGTLNNPLATIWVAPMGNLNPNDFYGEDLTLTTDLSTVKVTIAHRINRMDGTFYGLAYEAIVNGNAGTNSIRFRVGLQGSTFTGFTMVSHREHGGFGLKIINALVSDLPGKAADIAQITNILIQANATRSGISETYDGMIPALIAITTHYLSQINVE